MFHDCCSYLHCTAPLDCYYHSLPLHHSSHTGCRLKRRAALDRSTSLPWPTPRLSPLFLTRVRFDGVYRAALCLPWPQVYRSSHPADNLPPYAAPLCFITYFPADKPLISLPPIPFLKQCFGRLYGVPPHAVPRQGPLCYDNPGHAVTHRFPPSTPPPPSPPILSFSHGVVTGYDMCCSASWLAMVHLAVTIPLLSACSFY